MVNDQLIRSITEAVVKQLTNCRQHAIPVGVSGRHVHLGAADLAALFGGQALTPERELFQPGQFACREKVTLVGPKGVIENVRVLGPVRGCTQVELAASDCVKLGIVAPVRDSGDLAGSAGLTLVGACGAVTLAEGAIVAARHIHMHPDDAARYGVADGERVSVRVGGPRDLVFNEVLVRVSPSYRLELHIDYDEANAAGLKTGDTVTLAKINNEIIAS